MVYEYKLSQTYPICGAEVDCFSKVISLIEATVVGSRKGNYKLTSTLVSAYDLKFGKKLIRQASLEGSSLNPCHCSTHRNTMSHEDIGVHDGDELVQQVRLELKQLWRQLLHNIFKLFSGRRRNPIPSLRFTPGDERNMGAKWSLKPYLKRP